MSLEALWTQMDIYPEEGNGPAENRRLRESNPVQEKLLELKVELEQSKLEIAHLTERLEELPVCSLCALLPYDMTQSVKTKIAFEWSSNQWALHT